MDTTAGWKRGDYKRQCDICGHPWKRSKLRPIGQGRLACPDDFRGLTAEQITRHNASVPPLRVRAHKNVKPQSEIGTYQLDEALIFNAVRRQAITAAVTGPTGGPLPTTGPTGGVLTPAPTAKSMACSAIYLADIVEENLRPTAWVTQAAALLRAVVDELLAHQHGYVDGIPEDSEVYGGIDDPTDPFGVTGTVDTALGGVALLRAYAILGDQTYLAGAVRVGQYLRSLQCADVWANDSLSARTGGWSSTILHQGSPFGEPSRTLGIEAAIALWFLARLRDVEGGDAVHGMPAGGGFLSDTRATLDEMIAEARAFYITGSVTASGGSVPIAPLAPATIKSNYSFDNGDWNLDGGSTPTDVGGFNIACALRGVYELDGFSAEAEALYSWLVGFSSSATYNLTGSESPKQIAASTLGPYDPAFALATVLHVPNQQNNASLYDLRTIGMLAPVRVASGANMLDVKEALRRPRRRYAEGTPRDEEAHQLGTRVSCGLSLQISTTEMDIAAAALTGGIYRLAPQANANVRAAS